MGKGTTRALGLGLALGTMMGWTIADAAPKKEIDPRDVGPDTVDVSGYPEEQREAYKTFMVKCSKCHSLARPINAPIYEAEKWKKYIRIMMRRPGSGIDKDSAKVVYKFLGYYAGKRKKPTK